MGFWQINDDDEIAAKFSNSSCRRFCYPRSMRTVFGFGCSLL